MLPFSLGCPKILIIDQNPLIQQEVNYYWIQSDTPNFKWRPPFLPSEFEIRGAVYILLYLPITVWSKLEIREE